MRAQFAHGVGTHAASEFHINLKGAAVRFVSLVGIDDETGGQGTGECEVWVDNRLLAASGPLKGGQAAKRLTADLGARQQLLLRVKKGSGGLDFAHVDWAGGLLVLAADATAKPESVGTSESVEIWHSISPLPAINSPRITGATPGLPFLFLIPASGRETAELPGRNLPEGLTLDAAHRHHQRFVAGRGTTVVEMTVKNSHGELPGKLTIVGGEHQAGADAADGLELLELLGQRRERRQGPRGGRRHGPQRSGRPRFPVRQHRRLLGRPPRRPTAKSAATRSFPT